MCAISRTSYLWPFLPDSRHLTPHARVAFRIPPIYFSSHVTFPFAYARGRCPVKSRHVVWDLAIRAPPARATHPCLLNFGLHSLVAHEIDIQTSVCTCAKCFSHSRIGIDRQASAQQLIIPPELCSDVASRLLLAAFSSY